MQTKPVSIKRGASFVILTVVYVLAAVLGLILYRVLPFAWWLNLLLADVASTILTFIFSLIFRNASVYDPYWSVQPIVIVLAYAWGQPATALGVLLIAVICLWGCRLTANWAYTFLGLGHQDWRYTMLCQKTGVFYPVINFVGIHMVPTLIVYGCVLPAAYALQNSTQLHPASIFFLCLSVCAVTLQGTADFQMHRFRKNRTGTFIRTGLWKHARHPNYLGEILMWWGVGLAVVCTYPEMWYLCAGALANTVLFLTVSIPLADNRQSAKPGFAEYKKQTRKLLPIPKIYC